LGFAPFLLGISSQAWGDSLFVTGHDDDDHQNGAYQLAGLDFSQFWPQGKPFLKPQREARFKIGFIGNVDGSARGVGTRGGYTENMD